MDFDEILQEAGGRVEPYLIRSERPEIVNLLLARPEVITGMTIPRMVAPAWPDKPYEWVVARLSRPPWELMAQDIRESLLSAGWYWRDTPEGRAWYPPEFDSSPSVRDSQ